MIKEKAEAMQMWKTGYKKVKSKKEKKKRDCMMCYKPFMSEGNHNRICWRCKNTDDWAYGNDYGVIK